MLGFKSCEAAQAILVGIELMRMLKKDQLAEEARMQGYTRAEPFSSLAA
jgi:transposase-like protein